MDAILNMKSHAKNAKFFAKRMKKEKLNAKSTKVALRTQRIPGEKISQLN